MARRDGITPYTVPSTGETRYRARISWVGPDGTRQHRSASKRTRREAERWRRDALTKLDRGEWFEPQPVTMAEVAERWLATVERARAASTSRKYRKVWEGTVAPRFGARKIASVLPTEIQAYYDELAATYAAGTVRQVHKVLRGIFGHALADGLVRTDPTQDRRLPSDPTPPPEAWTPNQARAFLAAVQDDDDAIPLVVMLATGVRIGECLALHWSDVQLASRTAHIHRTLQQTRAGVRISDKTKTSMDRTIALPAVAANALRRQREISDGALVFARVDGRPLREGTVRDRLARWCERLYLPPIGAHGLRRTAVTLMMHQGVHPAIAARQTGHTVQTMMARYAAVNPDLQRQAADALDALFGAMEVADRIHLD